MNTFVQRIGTIRLIVLTILLALFLFFVLSNLGHVDVTLLPFVTTELPICLAIIYSAVLGSLMTLVVVYVRPVLAKRKAIGSEAAPAAPEEQK